MPEEKEGSRAASWAARPARRWGWRAWFLLRDTDRHHYTHAAGTTALVGGLAVAAKYASKLGVVGKLLPVVGFGVRNIQEPELRRGARRQRRGQGVGRAVHR